MITEFKPVEVQNCSSKSLEAVPIRYLKEHGKEFDKVNVMGILCHPPWDPKKTRANTFYTAITIQGDH